MVAGSRKATYVSDTIGRVHKLRPNLNWHSQAHRHKWWQQKMKHCTGPNTVATVTVRGAVAALVAPSRRFQEGGGVSAPQDCNNPHKYINLLPPYARHYLGG